MSQDQKFRRVLVAVDGSEISIRAFGHAARIARYDLFVVPSPPFETLGELGRYYNVARNEAKRGKGTPFVGLVSGGSNFRINWT